MVWAVKTTERNSTGLDEDGLRSLSELLELNARPRNHIGTKLRSERGRRQFWSD